MQKLDSEKIKRFGGLVMSATKLRNNPHDIGVLVEGYYITLQKEAERDARDRANGKGE